MFDLLLAPLLVVLLVGFISALEPSDYRVLFDGTIVEFSTAFNSFNLSTSSLSGSVYIHRRIWSPTSLPRYKFQRYSFVAFGSPTDLSKTDVYWDAFAAPNSLRKAGLQVGKLLLVLLDFMWRRPKFILSARSTSPLFCSGTISIPVLCARHTGR
jgi:hypothetical protein